MTLCIAWKKDETVHFATDSRVSLGAAPCFDRCIKVASVTMKILGPVREEDKYADQLFVSELGFCFSGNFLNAYTVKEFLTQALSQLQAIPGITKVSMENVCKLIGKFHDEISGSLLNSLFEKGLSQIIVTGYCPEQKSVRTFLFDFNVGDTDVTVSYTEILKEDNDIVFIGSGKTAAEERLPNVNSFSVLKTIKLVIDDEKESSVGGALQYGCTENRDFRVFGVRDYVVDHVNKTIKIEFQYAGINLDKNPYTVVWDEFHIRRSYIDPFQKEIERFFRSGYLLSTDSL